MASIVHCLFIISFKKKMRRVHTLVRSYFEWSYLGKYRQTGPAKLDLSVS